MAGLLPMMAQGRGGMQMSPQMGRSQVAVPQADRKPPENDAEAIMDLARQVIMSPGGGQAIGQIIKQASSPEDGIAMAIANVGKVIANTLKKQGMPVGPEIMARALVGIADLVLLTVVKMGMMQPGQAKSLAPRVLDGALQLWCSGMGKAPGQASAMPGR